MTIKLETPAQIDFSAEVSEWIEAFDDVVAEDWQHGAQLLETLTAEGARGWSPHTQRGDYAVSQYDSQAR